VSVDFTGAHVSGQSAAEVIGIFDLHAACQDPQAHSFS